MHLLQFSLFPREMYIPKFTIVLLYFWIVSRKNIHCVYFFPSCPLLACPLYCFWQTLICCMHTVACSHIQNHPAVFSSNALLSGPLKYSTLSNSCWGVIEKLPKQKQNVCTLVSVIQEIVCNLRISWKVLCCWKSPEAVSSLHSLPPGKAGK